MEQEGHEEFLSQHSFRVSRVPLLGEGPGAPNNYGRNKSLNRLEVITVPSISIFSTR